MPEPIDLSPEPEEFAMLEGHIRHAARQFPYPPTPDIAQAVRARLYRRPQTARTAPRVGVTAALVLLLVLGGVLAVPQVRATVLEFLGIGAVRVFIDGTTPPASTVEPPPTLEALDEGLRDPVLQFGGETTFEDAQDRLGQRIDLPDYPADLGEPERVFVQNLGLPMVSLVWLSPDEPGRARLSLHVIDSRASASKFEPQATVATAVNGQRALWLEAPRVFIYFGFDHAGDPLTHRADGNVLLWERGPLTYRLELRGTMDEAIRIAESIGDDNRDFPS